MSVNNTTDLSKLPDILAGSVYAIIIDETSTPGYTYIGKAATGSATSGAVWQIQRLNETVPPDLTIQWADGNGNFDNIWNNRTSITYS